MPPTTFRVSAVKPEEFSFSSEIQVPEEEIEKILTPNDGLEVIQASKFPEGSKIILQDNGFVRAVVAAYNQHQNLVIRPDDVWAAIMVQFSYYISKHSKSFRNKFGNFGGKKTLAVKLPGNMKTVDYGTFVQAMSNEIDRNIVDPNFKKWVMPNFSTTTENDRVVTGASVMGTTKKYFDYQCGLGFGIPSVTLEGTVEDWENIYGRLKQLHEYKLDHWYTLLEPAMKQFVFAKKTVAAKRGLADLTFWQRVCHYSEDSGLMYLTGWITAFCVFDTEGNWQAGPYASGDFCKEWPWPKLELDLVPTGIAEVSIILEEPGERHECVLYAGHMAMEIKHEEKSLTPVLAWAMATKTNTEKFI